MNVELELNIKFDHDVSWFEPSGYHEERSVTRIERTEKFDIWVAAKNIVNRTLSNKQKLTNLCLIF